MRILILRHADPDYAVDGLTPQGQKEAKLLAAYLASHVTNISAFYVSPLGRAQKTLAAISPFYPETPIMVCDWLHEFRGAMHDLPNRPGVAAPSCWDLWPKTMAENPELYSPEHWRDCSFMKEHSINVLSEYDKVVTEFDKILALHGYQRNGNVYSVTHSNHDVIAFVCHYGVSSVLLSRLMNCSPYSLWENICLLPSSLTEFVSEERLEGIAHFRALQIGSTAHLTIGGENPSFAARFCECFNDDTRH